MIQYPQHDHWRNRNRSSRGVAFAATLLLLLIPCLTLSVAASAQAIPQGIDPQSVQDLDGARNIWVSASQKIRGLASEAGPIETEYKSVFPRIEPLRKEIKRLAENRDKTLDDYRNGRWCSQCQRTKTQIEQSGENFEKHIARVEGVVVRPTQKQIDDKESELNAEIRSKLNDLNDLEKRESSLRSRYGDILASIQSLQGLWMRGIWQENSLHGDLWVKERTTVNDQIAALKKTVIQSDAAISKAKQKSASADDLAGLQAGHDAAISQIDVLRQKLVDRFSVVTSKQKEFISAKRADQEELTRIVGALGSIGPGGWGWGSLTGELISQNFNISFFPPLLWLDAATEMKKNLADLLEGGSGPSKSTSPPPGKPANQDVHDLLEGK